MASTAGRGDEPHRAIGAEGRSAPEEFPQAFEAAFARLQVALLEACGQESDWPTKVAAGVRSGLSFAAADPAAARVLASESLAHGAEGVARHERLVAYLRSFLAPGREVRPGNERLPGITERAMASGVVALVAQRLDLGKEDELAALAPEAIQFVLTPYLGAEEARRVALGGGTID